jgi:hypothetical protein
MLLVWSHPYQSGTGFQYWLIILFVGTRSYIVLLIGLCSESSSINVSLIFSTFYWNILMSDWVVYVSTLCGKVRDTVLSRRIVTSSKLWSVTSFNPSFRVAVVTYTFLLTHMPSNVLPLLWVGMFGGVTLTISYASSRNYTLPIAILFKSPTTTALYRSPSMCLILDNIHLRLRSCSLASLVLWGVIYIVT